MFRWFRLLFLKGYEWKVVCEPSTLYSGCWADPALWGETFYFPSFWQAWKFGKGYCIEHPFGKADIHYKKKVL